MTYIEYINYFINNPQNCQFIINTIDKSTYYYLIVYKNPDTGRESIVVSFKKSNGKLYDSITELEIGDVKDFNEAEFISLINKSKNQIFDKIKALELKKVTPSKYEDKGDHIIITINGGFNGTCNWSLYLLQITRIVQELDAWIIDLINDCPDDVWTLRIGIDK